VNTNGVHHTADEDLDQLYAFWPGTTPAPAPCPEAAFSLTMRGKLDGVEALLTVRGMTAAEFQRNLAAIKGLLDRPAAPPAQAEGLPQCPQGHGFLRKSTKHDGFYCPRKNADGTYCTGRA